MRCPVYVVLLSQLLVALLARASAHHASDLSRRWSKGDTYIRHLESRDNADNTMVMMKPPVRGYGPVNITQPGTDPKAMGAAYARFVQLGRGGHMLLTYQGPDFPIFESFDYGTSWKNITVVKHSKALHFQPYLYRLPADIGDLKRNTVLLAGNAIGDNGTEIFIYASVDEGQSWRYLSTVARGTNPFAKKTDDGVKQKAHPVWEPALLLYNGTLACYYSDERDSAHSQKLAHQESKDGVTWGDVINDVATSAVNERPGMTNIARMGNHKWILVYEFGVADGHSYPVYLKIATSPLQFDKVDGKPLRAKNGTVPGSSPYVAWTPYGGDNGTLIVTAATTGSFFLNYAYGEGDWIIFETKSLQGYSPAVDVAEWSDNLALVASGDPYGGGAKKGVTFTAVELPPSKVAAESSSRRRAL